jgi:NADPH:quinone reductase-like Zn-dependent oxidoreductase
MHHARRALSVAWVLAVCMPQGRAADTAPQIPQQQQAFVQNGTGGLEILKLETIPVLQAGPGRVLIRVHAAALNPADLDALERPAPDGKPVRRVIGVDVAGVIVAVGPDTPGRSVGMPVFGVFERQDTMLNGAYQQYASLRIQNTAPKPANLTYAQAAGLGVVGVTALRLLDQAKVASGQRVLINGVAGGVGSTAAQMALARGTKVVGTASPRHAKYLQSIGVTEVIDYRQGNVADKAGKVDAVIDAVGDKAAADLLRTVKPGGHFASTAGAPVTPEQCATAKVECSASPGNAATAPLTVLEQVGQLAAAGKLRTNIDKTYPLERLVEALKYLQEGHAEGKVIIAVTAEADRR